MLNANGAKTNSTICARYATNLAAPRMQAAKTTTSPRLFFSALCAM